MEGKRYVKDCLSPSWAPDEKVIENFQSLFHSSRTHLYFGDIWIKQPPVVSLLSMRRSFLLLQVFRNEELWKMCSMEEKTRKASSSRKKFEGAGTDHLYLNAYTSAVLFFFSAFCLLFSREEKEGKGRKEGRKVGRKKWRKENNEEEFFINP